MEGEEERLFRMATTLPTVLSNTRAYEGTVMDIFTGIALQDIVFAHPKITALYKRLVVLGDYIFAAPLHATRGNSRLLVGLLHLDPISPAVITTSAKIVLYASATFGGFVIVVEGLVLVLSGPFIIFDFLGYLLEIFSDSPSPEPEETSPDGSEERPTFFLEDVLDVLIELVSELEKSF